MARSLRENDIDNYNGTQVPGYYQRTHLNNIINNFMVGYVGDDKILTNIPRHEIAFWGQRAVQEFSFDVLHSEKSLEIEVNPDTKSFNLPPDYVNYVSLAALDNNGNSIPLRPSQSRRPAQQVIQDSNYMPVFDSDGNIIQGEPSTSETRFGQVPYDEDRKAIDYYNGYYYNDDFSYYNQKRFGFQPQLANQDKSYLLDNSLGIVYLSHDVFNTYDSNGAFDGFRVVFTYISDGLADGNDLDNVLVPKMAEDAIYADILYNLAKIRPSTAAMAPGLKKEAMAKKRNTKIRLMNMKSQEMIDIMRTKSKWIKH